MKLADFAGNEAPLRRLTRTGLPQSSILAGPAGVGKRTLALLLAEAMQCPASGAGEACGECESCLRVEAGSHPDVFLVEPHVGRTSPDLSAGLPSLSAINLDPPPKEQRRGRRARIVDVFQIRELNREAHKRPFSGRIRLFIVDPADLMNDEASNALLKTLEEPIATTFIVLITTNPDGLLPTILSRCQLFRFGGVPRDEIANFLTERTELDRPELRAAFAGGSLGRAVTMDLDRYLEVRDRMWDFLTAGLSGSFSRVFGRLEDSAMAAVLKDRERSTEALEQLESLAFDLYYVKIESPERALNQDLLPALAPVAEEIALDHLRELLHHIGEARADVARFVRAALCFEGLWLDLEAGPTAGTDHG